MSVSFGKEFGIGCGDNSCRWGSRGGMATNGGCRCFERIRANSTDAELKQRLATQSGIAALRTLAGAPEIMLALRALVAAAKARGDE